MSEAGATYRAWLKCGGCLPLRDTPMDLTPSRLAVMRSTPGVTFHCAICVELALMNKRIGAEKAAGEAGGE